MFDQISEYHGLAKLTKFISQVHPCQCATISLNHTEPPPSKKKKDNRKVIIPPDLHGGIMILCITKRHSYLPQNAVYSSS